MDTLVQRGERAPPPYAHHSAREGNFLKYFALLVIPHRETAPPASYVRRILSLCFVIAMPERREANCEQPDKCFPFLFTTHSTLIRLGITANIANPIRLTSLKRLCDQKFYAGGFKFWRENCHLIGSLEAVELKKDCGSHLAQYLKDNTNSSLILQNKARRSPKHGINAVYIL